ncbi:MAG: FAD-dependent oxidoreductase [Pseudomonadota bacterium]
MSDDLFHLERFPKRLVVAGGGYIALEFASIFNALGSDVTVIYRGAEVLKDFDHDIRRMLAREMEVAGIKFHLFTTIPQIEKRDDGMIVTLSDGEKLEADEVLFAIGREPLIDGLGLSDVGVKTNDAGAIQVNEEYQTSVPSIYAIGDVTDRVNLTPVAIREGHWLADHFFGAAKNKIDYADVTTAVFTTPELASVGLSEERAIKEGYEVDVYRTRFRAMRYVITPSDSYSMMKLVVDRKTDKVLGAHMLGETAAEIIQSLAVAVTMGATKADVDRTVALHPTVAEEFVTMRERATSTLETRLSQAAE